MKNNDADQTPRAESAESLETDSGDLAQAGRDLDSLLSEAMPALSRNVGQAHQEYVEGKIAAGAFRYVMEREALAAALIGNPYGGRGALSRFRCASQITIDLTDATKDNPQAGEMLGRWLELFRRAGFVEKHPLFDIPVLPEEAAT